MQETSCLLLHGFYDARVRVPGGHYCNASIAVKKAIPIDVFDDRSLSASHDKWVRARIGRRQHRMVAIDD